MHLVTFRHPKLPTDSTEEPYFHLPSEFSGQADIAIFLLKFQNVDFNFALILKMFFFAEPGIS